MEALAFLEVAKACQEVVVVGSSSSSSSMMANASKECVMTKTRRAVLAPFRGLLTWYPGSVWDPGSDVGVYE